MSHWILILVSAFCGGTEEQTVDFDTEIVPVLTRYGCNAGACHGSATGRGDFKLSLFGSRPESDHRAIAWQFGGRRINGQRPTRSLLLLKPSGEFEHGGDRRFALDSEAGRLLVQWIEQGAKRSGKKSLVSLTVSPDTVTTSTRRETIQLQARATFNDGTRRDVTPWTVFEAQDKLAIELDARNATAKPLLKGRHIVIARYLDQVASVEILVPVSDVTVDHSKQLRANFVDDLIYEKLESLAIPVSEPVSDAAFLRRIFLDLTGALPGPDDLQSFLLDEDPEKRQAIIDRLMNTDAFVDFWTYRMGQWLRVGARSQDAVSSGTYYRWLRDQIKSGRPLDKIVRTLITSSGDTHRNGPANFHRASEGPRQQAEFVSQALLGTQFRCANCHDHPYDRWTQDDYHGFAAIFAKVRRGRNISFDSGGELIHPATGERAKPKLPGSVVNHDHPDGLQQLADWVADRDNPFFAKAFTNRIWSSFLGRGLVEPVDDLRSTNPSTHPELLDRLANHFIENKFDFRQTIRLICNSAAYQRSSLAVAGNESDSAFYSRALTRDMAPEVLSDALVDVTGIEEMFASHPQGSRAIHLHQPGFKSEMLEILGRCSSEKTCQIGEATRGGMARQLQMINGALLNRRMEATAGRLNQLIKATKENEPVIEELYLRCFSRMPDDEEIQFWMQQFNGIGTGDDRLELFEDLFWSLLTSREFITNH